MTTFFSTLIAQSSENTSGGVVIDLKRSKSQVGGPSDFIEAFNTFTGAIILVGAIVAFGYMLWGALEWILSGGDTGKIESARKKITQSVIGLVVLVCVFAFFMAVQYVLGLDVFTELSAESTSTGNSSSLQ